MSNPTPAPRADRPAFQTEIRIDSHPATNETMARTAIAAIFPGGGVRVDAPIDAPEGVWLVEFDGMPEAMVELVIHNGWSITAAIGPGRYGIDIPAI